MTEDGRTPGGMPDVTRGILWMIVAVFLFVVTDTLAKVLTASFPVIQVTWFRLAFHLLLMVAVFNRRLPKLMKSAMPGRQIVRSVLLLTAMIFLTLGLRIMPLADLTAVMQATPLLVTLLAVPLLGERVGLRRIMGVVAGLTGALIIVRPGFGMWDWAAAFPLAASVCFAGYQVMTRLVSRTDAPLTSMAWTPWAGTLCLVVAMPWHWVTPDGTGWLLLVCLGVVGGISQFCLIKAVTAAPASVVAPYLYSGLIWGTLFGYVVFGDFPDMWTFAGAGLIVASGLYIFHRERMAATA